MVESVRKSRPIAAFIYNLFKSIPEESDIDVRIERYIERESSQELKSAFQHITTLPKEISLQEKEEKCSYYSSVFDENGELIESDH